MTTLKERLSRALAYAGLSQSEAARRMGGGATQQSISLILKGSTQRTRLLVDLAGVCGVRPEWLAKDEGDMLVAPKDTAPLLTTQESELIRLFRELGPDARQAVIGLAETLGRVGSPFRGKRRA